MTGYAAHVIKCGPLSSGRTAYVGKLRSDFQRTIPRLLRGAIDAVKVDDGQTKQKSPHDEDAGDENSDHDDGANNDPLNQEKDDVVEHDVYHDASEHPDVEQEYEDTQVATFTGEEFYEALPVPWNVLPNPAVAKSDGANMLRLDLLEELMEKLVRLRKAL